MEAAAGRQRLKFLGIAFVCLLPVLAGYILYYFWQPTSFNNYGLLIQPQRPAKELNLTDLDGKPFSLDQFRKRFVMVTLADSDCLQACKDQLYMTRQLRTMQGKDRERVDRLWILHNDQSMPSPTLLTDQDGLAVVRADRQSITKLFSLAPNEALQDHIYLIDYQGNLMMRFPKQPDPYKIKKDLSILLRAASVR
jgi:hypothetical protein